MREQQEKRLHELVTNVRDLCDEAEKCKDAATLDGIGRAIMDEGRTIKIIAYHLSQTKEVKS